MKSFGFDQIATTRRVAASSYQSSVASSTYLEETTADSSRVLLNVFSHFKRLFSSEASFHENTQPALKRFKKS